MMAVPMTRRSSSRGLHALHPPIKVIRLNRNYGQHLAIFAGLEQARGEIVVTLDGDLQNPPEEIPRLLEKIQEGYDVVCGQRSSRQDPLRRKIPSYLSGEARLTARGRQDARLRFDASGLSAPGRRSTPALSGSGRCTSRPSPTPLPRQWRRSKWTISGARRAIAV